MKGSSNGPGTVSALTPRGEIAAHGATAEALGKRRGVGSHRLQIRLAAGALRPERVGPELAAELGPRVGGDRLLELGADAGLGEDRPHVLLADQLDEGGRLAG